MASKDDVMTLWNVHVCLFCNVCKMAAERFAAKLICFAGFLDLLAVSMILPLIATRAKELGATPGLGGLIGSLYGATQLFSSPIFGSWSDVRGRKFVLMLSLLSTSGLYLILGSVGLLGLTLIRLLTGVLKHSQSLSQAYLSSVVLPAEKSKYYGYFTATSNIGFIIGPTLGGHLVELENGFFWVSLVSSFVFFCNAVIIWQFLPNIHRATKTLTSDSTEAVSVKLKITNDESYVSSTRNYVKELRLDKSWEVLCLRLVLAFSTLVFRSNYSLVLRDRFGLSGKEMGYLISYQGIVSSCAGFLVGHLSKITTNEHYQVLYGVATLTVALSGLTIAPNVFYLVISLTLLCVATSFLRVCLTHLMISRCPKEKVGAIVGFGQSVTSAARMMSPLVGGFALEIGNYGPGLVASATSGFGLILSIYLITRPVPKEKTS